ncbi:hypothetical protein EIN_173480 [Entamoeba invadens IP1]|uniref:Thioredoxin domain-containing protein n=1 Tax=Entamoeba invadens IP1 TaxID=370355 RepID=A0A0A1U191_ENTIV|nr:hypothetical protein EIN_173480 [Entamoeba invadens IP1]ELP84673.1 hypothetical protein EIN_173480 [Entamoeba invadens IP1]|eukprot:XP_004184019.1 hypothetical protein EIN_173480 [Entamoeba invadens IP1]
MLLFLLVLFVFSVCSVEVRHITDLDRVKLQEESKHVMLMILLENDDTKVSTYQTFAQKNQDLDVDFCYTIKQESLQIVRERDISLFPAFVIIRHHDQKDMILQGGFDIPKIQQFFEIGTLPIIYYFMDSSSVQVFSKKAYTTSFVFERNKDVLFNPFLNEYATASYKLAPLSDTSFYYTESSVSQYQLIFNDNMRYSDESDLLVYSPKSNLSMGLWMDRVAFPLFQPVTEDSKSLLVKANMKAIIIVSEDVTKQDYLNYVSIARAARGHIALMYCTKGSFFDTQIGGEFPIRVVNENFERISEGGILEDLIKKYTDDDKIGDLRSYKISDDESNPLYDMMKLMMDSGSYQDLFESPKNKPYIDLFMGIIANKTLSNDVFALMNQFTQIDFYSEDSDVDEIIDFLKNEKLWATLDVINVQHSSIPKEQMTFLNNLNRIVHDEVASKTLETIVRRTFRSQIVRNFFKENPVIENVKPEQVIALANTPEIKAILEDIQALMKTVEERKLIHNEL